MDQNATIKAMEAHAEKFGLKLTTIGQLAVNNRNAYARLLKGTAQIETARRVLDWIKADRASRRRKART